MIVCKSKDDYKILKSLRAHGWDRELKKQKIKGFNFINEGFNLRPMDISASIGMSQFKRLNMMMVTRSKNRDMIIKKLMKSKNWNNQFNFFNPSKNFWASSKSLYEALPWLTSLSIIVVNLTLYSIVFSSKISINFMLLTAFVGW